MSRPQTPERVVPDIHVPKPFLASLSGELFIEQGGTTTTHRLSELVLAAQRRKNAWPPHPPANVVDYDFNPRWARKVDATVTAAVTEGGLAIEGLCLIHDAALGRTLSYDYRRTDEGHTSLFIFNVPEEVSMVSLKYTTWSLLPTSV